MNNITLTAPLSIFISLAAIAGVSVHDTKLDKMTTTVVGTPSVMSITDPGFKAMRGDDHTHVERVSLRDVTSQSPRIMPRYGEQKRHMMQKSVPKGHHPFDGYGLPIT